MLRRSQASAAGVVGIDETPDGVAIARILHEDGRIPRLDLCEHRAVKVRSDRAAVLAAVVDEYGLAGARCIRALPLETYTTRLVDAPPVEPAELPEAARWLVRDLVDFPVEDAAIDVLPVAESEKRGRTRRICVVAARGDALRMLADEVRAAGLVLDAFAVRELALLATLPPAPDPGRATAVIALGAKSGLIAIGRDQRLCVARRLGAGSDAIEPELDALETGRPGAGSAALEELVLEVQRSLDFYESEFGNAAVAEGLVAPTGLETGQLVEHLGHHLPINVQELDLARTVQPVVTLSRDLQRQCLFAIGAALTDRMPVKARLWTGDLPTSRFDVTGRRILHAAAAAWVALLALHGLARQQTASSESTLMSLESERTTLETRVQALRARAAVRTTDTGLSARVDALTRERVAHARRLEALGGASGHGERRFAAVLEALARRPVEGLWLREIRLVEGGESMSLAGSALEPELVPRFVRALHEEPTLAGVEFSTLRLERPIDDPGRIDFFVGAPTKDAR